MTPAQAALETVEGGVRFTVKVSPGASRDRVAGVMADGSIKLQVRAAPQKGRANRAVIELLANALGISPGQVRIQRGHGSSRKQVVAQGIAIEAARRLLR